AHLEGVPRGDERTALHPRLHDDCHAGQRGNDAVAPRKRSAVRCIIRLQLTQKEPASSDLPLERRVSPGIVDVDAGAEHGDRRAANLERAAVAHRIYTTCEAADHARAGSRERARELSRDTLGIRGCATSADDGDRWQ